MNMNNLRNDLIRVAHSNPELRKDILPLVTASMDYIGKVYQMERPLKLKGSFFTAWFVPKEKTKSGSVKGVIVTRYLDGRDPKKALRYEIPIIDFSRGAWKPIRVDEVPDKVKARFSAVGVSV